MIAPRAEVRVCTTLSEVGSPQEWNALTARAPASVCGSREWAEASFAAAHPHARPVLLAARVDKRLVGLLGLALHDRDRRPELRFVGSPENDLSDVLVLSGYEHCVDPILQVLDGLVGGGWSVRLDDVDPDGLLVKANREHGVLDWTEDEAAPVVDLRGAWGSAISGRRRRQWNRMLRKLHHTHEVQFRRVDGGQVAVALPEFLRMHEARRRAQRRPHALPPTSFLELVIDRLAPSGRCAFMDLVIDGAPVARDLYLLDRSVAMMWLRSLDPAWRRFSCGHLLLRASAEVFASEGYARLDLGRGDEPYKFLFGAQPRMLMRGTALARCSRQRDARSAPTLVTEPTVRHHGESAA